MTPSDPNTIIKTELFKNIESLVNEIELSFDYVKSSDIQEIHKFVTKLKTDETSLISFSDTTFNHLHKFEKDLSLILFSKQKIRTPAYKFLDNIKLFNKKETILLDFAVFTDENKNTKKSLLKYLYNIYMACFFINTTSNKGDISIGNELNNFLSNITKEAAQTATQETYPDPDIEEISIPSTQNVFQIPGANLGGLENLMSSLMNNTDIMNIANEISNEMKNDTINPMELMTSMMSGNMTDGPLGDLMSKIQASVDSKLNSGELDQNALQEQAKNIMNSVQETPELFNIPGLSEMLNQQK